MPLSYFGIIDKTSLVWTTLLIIVAIALFWGGITRINQFFKDFKQKIILKSVVLFSFICLIMVAIIPMNEGLWHKLPAILFFSYLITSLFFALDYLEVFLKLEMVFFQFA